MRRSSSADDSDRRERSDSNDTFAAVVNSFTLDSQRRGQRGRQRDRTDEVEQDHAQPGVEDPDGLDAEAPSASSVRSYTWTGGRTRTTVQLELETLVSTGDAYRPAAVVRVEHQSIAELCQHPRSVAEVGALLSVPVGVARVLLSDMAELGLITVHNTVSESGSAPHMMLMERVLSGLRRL